MQDTTGQDEIEVPVSSTTDTETQGLFRSYRATQNPDLRDQIVNRHLHLVHSVARRFSGWGESLDDLAQEGTIGLLNAIDLFDIERGVKFSTYACHLIASQIQHYLRDRGRLIRQPAWVQELNTKILRAAEQLAQDLGRDALPEEIATYLNITEESVNNVLAARELNKVISLTIPSDNSDGETSLLEREVLRPGKDTGNQWGIEDNMEIDEAIQSLKPLEQQVVRLFFFGDLNQTEIARKLGISVNYASYLLRRALTKIKAFLDEQRKQEVTAFEETEVVAPAGSCDAPVFDPLTGLNSGAYLHARVAEEVARSRRYPANFTLMLVHATGVTSDEDQRKATLCTIGQVLRGSIRVVDLLGHLQDGMFAMLLPHTGREARILAERMCQRIGNRGLPGLESIKPVTISVGFAVFPMDGVGVDQLFSRAETALRVAEKSGPNQVSGVPRPTRGR